MWPFYYILLQQNSARIFLDNEINCCCCLVTSSCPALCDPMDCSTSDFPVLHYLPVCSNPCPLSQWCYLTISSSAAPFSSCPQSFSASRSFPVSWLFTSGGQSIRHLPSVLPMNIQGWFPLWLTSFISLQFKGHSRLFSSTTVGKHQFFSAQESILCICYVFLQVPTKKRTPCSTQKSECLQNLLGITSGYLVLGRPQ